LRFREFEAYAATVGDADLRMMLSRLKQPWWEIHSHQVGEFRLQFGREGGGNIAEGIARQGGRLLFVPLAGFHRANGLPIDESSLLMIDPGSEFTIAVHEEHDWCSIFVPSDLLNRESPHRDSQRSIRPFSRVVDVGQESMGRLRWVLTRVLESIRVEPTVLSAPLALGNIQADLIAACRPIVSGNPPPSVSAGRPRIPRPETIRIVRETLERFRDEVLSMADLAAAADVSERTLRNVFLDQYGVPPLRYLTLHRLHQVRAALRVSEPEATTVTAMAARFGFWHAGPFAAEYRRLFGEPPSQTLRGRSKVVLRMSTIGT